MGGIIGGIGDAIGGIVGGIGSMVGGLLGGGVDYSAQNQALQAQTRAQEQALKIQQRQAQQNAALQQQQMKKASAGVANAAAAVSDTPTVYNPANLTGGLGVDKSDLLLGSSSLLSGKKKDDQLL